MFVRVAACLLAVCAAEQRWVADELALVQKAVDGPSAQSWKVVDPTTGLVKANRAHTMKTQAAVSMAASRGVKRILHRFNATKNDNTFVSMLKWSLTGKLSEWAMGFYKEPKETSELDAIDSLVGLITRALDESSKSMSDKEVIARVLDWAQLHKIVRDYSAAEGEIPEVMTVVDAVGGALEANKPTTLPEMRKTVADAMKGLSDLPMADLVKYLFNCLTKQEKPDSAAFMEKLEPALKEVGIPESSVSYLMDFVEERKSKEKFNFREFVTKTAYMLAETATDLNMPEIFSELTQNLGTIVAQPLGSNESVIVYKLMNLGKQWQDALVASGLPKEVTDYPVRAGQCFKSTEVYKKQGDMEFLVRCAGSMLADISLAIGHPPEVVNLINFTFTNFMGKKSYLRDNTTNMKFHRDRADLVLASMDQVGFPPQFLKWLSGQIDTMFAGTFEWSPTPEVFTKKWGEFFRFLGMPAMSSAWEQGRALFGHKYAAGEHPNAEALFRFITALIDLPGDVSRVKQMNRRIRKRVLGPIDRVFGNSTAVLAEKMPDSFMKRVAMRNARKLLK